MMILTILNVIGIIFLLFLIFIILLLAMILLVPIRYRGTGKKQEHEPSPNAEMHFTWLFHAIHGTISYDSDGMKWNLKLFGFRIVEGTNHKGGRTETDEDLA